MSSLLSLSLLRISFFRFLFTHEQYFSEARIDLIGACLSIIEENRIDHWMIGRLIPSVSFTPYSQQIPAKSARNPSLLKVFIDLVVITL